jgi:hypothetical protein
MSARKKQRRRASPREQHRRQRQRQEEEQRLLQRRFDDNPNKILSIREWCVLNGLAARTGRRLISGEYGKPPVITRLSPRRIGISLAANAEWQKSRQQGAA